MLSRILKSDLSTVVRTGHLTDLLSLNQQRQSTEELEKLYQTDRQDNKLLGT